MSKLKNKRLGDLLLEAGIITQIQLIEALELQKATGKKIGQILHEKNIVTQKQIIEILELQLGIPHIDISKSGIDLNAVRLVDESLAKRYILIPVSRTEKILTVAMEDPTNIFAIDDIRMATGLEIKPMIAAKNEILKSIREYYDSENANRAVEEFEKNEALEEVETLEEEELNQLNSAPVVKLVNSIMKQAVNRGASDIHIEPYEKYIRVRIRVDGDLQEIMTPSKTIHASLTTRIKIMAKMNIVEKRIPQDGRIEMNIEGRQIDLRVSVLPTIHGEKTVIRLLDSGNFMVTKKELGFTDKNLSKLENIIQNPNGIILVTGPTGSGKSTTLYTILRELNDDSKNIITVEDPVEYQLEGVNQVNVNTKTGLTFASALKSILRQDPDIIMIGEIRDEETAQIATRAAITGHLVLSTMHTNDTASTVARLIDTGVEPYLVSSSLKGVTAQRLVKKICNECKEAYKANEREKRILEMPADQELTIYKGIGCTSCNSTGYSGRTAIHEILMIDGEIRKLIDARATTDEIRDNTESQNMTSLKANCVDLVLAGVTTVTEVLEVANSLD